MSSVKLIPGRVANCNTLELMGRVTVLFSYQTPVAIHVAGSGSVRTTTHYSPTTSRHINQFLRDTAGVDPKQVPGVPQAAIDQFLSGWGCTDLDVRVRYLMQAAGTP